MRIVWMVHVHYIKFLFHLVLGSPPPILAISGNIFFINLESTGFKIVKSVNITIVAFPSFSVGASLGYVTSFSLNVLKYRRLFFFNVDIRVVGARILVSLGSVLVYYFVTIMLLYF